MRENDNIAVKHNDVSSLKGAKDKLKSKIKNSGGESLDFDTQFRLEQEDVKLIHKMQFG